MNYLTPDGDTEDTDYRRPARLRAQLLNDIFYDTNPLYSGPLEVSSDALIDAFSDILLPVWCKAVGVDYTVNQHPLPEFRSKTTIIFTPSEPELEIDYYNDNEL